MFNDDDDVVCNKSGNRPFADVMRVNASRRNLLKGGLATAATGFFGPSLAWSKAKSNLLRFRPVPLVDGGGPVPSISRDYYYDVLIPWGSPIQPGGPEYNGDPNTRPTADEQAQMIGIGHDGMWFFRGWQSDSDGMLCINHEFGRNSHVLGKDEPESLEDVRLSQHAHGVSVVNIAEIKGKWRLKGNKLNRRIHVNTPVTFSGPVADDPLLATPAGNVPLGTVNNCSSGYTPWGTYLTCEENFNGYFGATNQESTWAPTPAQERYGFSEGGFGYGWEKFDRRFDLSDLDFTNEENRFGWVVEIDPFDATALPVKRTALGRFKHEGATVTVGRGGRAVVYMGDDQRFDYIYKFVSADNWRAMRAKGKSPLDEGTLYVAKFNDDGTGEWIALNMDNPVLAAKFTSEAEILTFARLAADEVGATPMDRPEWTTVAPNGDVYCTLTNNSRREIADGPNPLAPNADGHIIRWRDSNDHVGETFEWNIFLIAQTTHGTEESFSDPDGIWADNVGRLFIETDGGQKDGLNNQLLVADTVTGEIKRLLTGVTSDEITGLTIAKNQTVMFVNTQHPGNGDPTLTNFPAPTDGVTIPRDCTFVIRRKDGGKVGS